MSRNRKSNRQFTAIGDVLAGVLSKCRQKSHGDLSRVWQLWDSAVGSAIAANTRPVSLKGRQMVVLVANSPWLHQLQFLKKQMIDEINRRMGEVIVDEIKFKIGSL